MTDKSPPQWAIDEAQAIFGKIEFDGYIYGTAYAIAKERERCAKICADESQRLLKFHTRDGVVLSLCAEQMAMKIRDP